MNTKRVLALVLALMMTLTLFGCGEKPAEDGTDDAPKTVTITDMIGRQVEIVPGSYQRVVCIGADALRVPEQKVKEIRDTVATLRLDAVTAAGFSMSRGKAAELIAAGRVQKNYREVTKGDASVAQGDVISARGLGKFEVAEVGGLSKKGRTGILLRR